MSYWDTSALVKLFVAESDSAQYESLALASQARTVFRRREAEGAVPLGQGAALYSRLTGDIASGVLRLQPETDDMEREFGTVLEACFSQVSPVFIRTNDALHLAAARVAGETEFVTADGRQRAAAQLLGFRVLP